MNGSDYIKEKQIYWAKRNGLNLLGSIIDKGLPIYTETLEKNLFEPLTKKSKEQFESGDGGEIKDSAKVSVRGTTSFLIKIFYYFWPGISLCS
jgi:hypothetical protein